MKKDLSTDIYCSVEVFGIDEMIEQIKKIETEIEKLNEMKVEAIVSLPKIKSNPKYTLTETEKHIVLAIDEKWKWIARDRDGLHIYTTLPKFDYCFSDFGCTDGYTEYFNVFIDNFEYVIENQEPVSLDELREIAKK